MALLFEQEESENKLAVQEALSMMASAFKGIDGSNMKLMEALIVQNIEKVTNRLFGLYSWIKSAL